MVTALCPKIVVSADGRGVVGHAGARLLADLADATGLTPGFSDAGLRVRDAGHDPGRVAVDLAVLLADGGATISDLAVLRNEPDLFGAVASDPTVWRVLSNVGESGWPVCVTPGPGHGNWPGRRRPRPARVCPSRRRQDCQSLVWSWIWELALTGIDLLAWTQHLLLDGELAVAEPKKPRYRLLRVATRLTRTARQTRLRIAGTWPWATDLATAFTRLTALLRPIG
ncbi:transposase [Dactylosporangium sp. NPDC051484]|uniref:transposase n=1 Tax=Dactylosporangium sp. NPDC051484 TaxID=3154942 RepID=UPI003450D2A8